jgi:hypothetical protein
MKFDSLIADGFKAFGLRFSLVGLLPGGVLCLFVLALTWSGAPERSPDLGLVIQRATQLRTAEAVVLGVGVLLVALLLQPLQLSLVRFLEGYWGDSWLADKVSETCIRLQRRRRLKLFAADANFDAHGPQPDAALGDGRLAPPSELSARGQIAAHALRQRTAISRGPRFAALWA